MSSYADLIPGSSPSRRRSAYDDLLPGGAPAATVQPAEDARLDGVEAATVPRVADVARAALPDLWGEARPEDPVEVVRTDASDNLYEPPGAEWGQVLRSIIPGAGAQIRSAVANLRRQSNEESIGGREMVLEPPSDPNSPQEVAYGTTLRKARERQRTRLAQEIAARPEIQADAAAARQDLAAATPKDMSTVQQAVHSAATSAPTTLTGLVAGIATRSPAVGMAIAGGGGSTIQAGATYGEALEKLLSDGVPKAEAHRRASLAAIGDAAIEGFDAIPVGVALKRGSAVAKRILKTAGVESLTEGGQQLLQDLRSKAMENPELTLGEMWQNLKVAVLSGGIGGSVYGGIGAAANAGRGMPAEAPVEDAGEAPVAEEVSTPAKPPAPAVPAPAAPSPYADLIPARVVDESAQFEERATAAEAAHTARVDAMNARQTAKIEAAKTAAGGQQAPVQAEPLAIEDPGIRTALQDMAKNEAGWAEIGGRMIRNQVAQGGLAGGGRTVDQISRTQWIPKSDWWKGRPGALNEAQTQEAVRKALAGEKLTKREHLAVDYMVEVANQRITERKAERRADFSTRARVDDMTQEQMRRELLTSPFGEIGNRRAYDETVKKPVQVAVDADSLKWINDNLGHEAGDELLRAIGESLAAVAPQDSYHISGDEFVLQAEDDASAERVIAAFADEIGQREITYEAPDGRIFTYVPRISHGQGSTLKEADTALGRAKTEREAAGQRAGRGERPVGLDEATPIGGEAEDQPAQGFELEQQTEAQLAARARAQAEAEARRISEEQAAENKRRADAQRGDFTLTGSERTADVNPQQGVLGMPAGTITAGTFPTAAAAGATPPARAQAKVSTEQARPDAIRAAMQELFGAPISEKHQGRKNLGIYRVKPQTIRLKNRNDLRTAAHEVGHHISERNQPFRAVMKQHAAELISIMPAAYKAQIAAGKPMPKKLQIEEGFAEFIADYITEPTTLQAKVPGFYKAFETWLGQNPEYAQSLQRVADMVGAHEALDPADRILAKVGMFKPPIGQRVATLASKDSWDTFAQATLDKWHPLKVMVEDLAPGMAASKNPYAAARLLAGDAAIIEDWVSDFTTPFDYAKRLDGKNYGKPLRAIFEPVLEKGEAEINKFKAYLIARRAFELKRAGKENLFTTEEIAQGLSLETPLFKKTAAEVYAYNDRLVDYAVEGGLLSPEVATKFKQYANYIPFFRESEGEGKAGGRGDPFKRLMGGTANLRDPIANLIQNTANIIHATNRNAMVAKAVALAKAVHGGGRWIESVQLPQQAHNISTQRILDDLQKQGVQIDTTMAQDMAAIQTFFMPSGKADERTRTIVYKQGGELKAAQVNDPILWKALGNIPPLQMGLLNKILAFPAQTLRAGVVLDPTFMVRNGVRDTLSATVQSKGKFIPVLSTAQGIKMMAQSRDSYRLWRAFGGSFADQFRDSDEAVRIIQRMGKRGGFSPDSIISPMRWLDALKRVGAFTEAGSRVGEFAATYKPGDIDSALQAALNSREVSTDFGMRGGSEAIQVLTRMTPFMNPAMQGLYKTARVLSTGDGKAAAVKAAVLGTNMALFSVALALINSDEDWYREIEEWEKTTYWHFKVGEQVYRIAKPFEYGTLFASMPEAIALRIAAKEGGEDFKKRMLQSLGFVFGFRVIPQVGTLVAEPWANKSFFTGRKLVPDRQRDLEPGLQAHPSSSKVAQATGEKLNISPAVIDNVVRNFFGTMGVHASTVADLMLEQTGAFPPGRERSWQTWPAIKAFVRDPENPNTKQMRDFYEALEKYRRAVNTVKEYRNRGEDTKADRYAVEKSEEISMAKSAEVAARRLAKLRKAVRSIEWIRDMTPAEKRETVRDYNEEMQSIAAEQTQLYQAAKRSSAGAEGAR